MQENLHENLASLDAGGSTQVNKVLPAPAVIKAIPERQGTVQGCTVEFDALWRATYIDPPWAP